MIGVLHLNFLGGKILLWAIVPFVALAVLLIAGTAVGRRRHVVYDATRPGLYGVTGRFGGGKSYFMTWCASIALSRSRMVFSTYEIGDWMTFDQWAELAEPQHLGGSILIDQWEQIINVPNNCLVIIDEAHGWWPSDARSSPIEVRMWLSTLRHRDITVFWATQRVGAVGRWLRELSFGIWECTAYKQGIHRCTLFQHDVISKQRGKRPFESRILVKREQSIMTLYDTKNTARYTKGFNAPPSDRTGQPITGEIRHRSAF